MPVASHSRGVAERCSRGGGGSSSGGSGAERVRCEVEAMRRVLGHPHIVSLKSCHEDEKGVHLAMVSEESFFFFLSLSSLFFSLRGREKERA